MKYHISTIMVLFIRLWHKGLKEINLKPKSKPKHQNQYIKISKYQNQKLNFEPELK
jgi:hypothetical protein